MAMQFTMPQSQTYAQAMQNQQQATQNMGIKPNANPGAAQANQQAMMASSGGVAGGGYTNALAQNMGIKPNANPGAAQANQQAMMASSGGVAGGGYANALAQKQAASATSSGIGAALKTGANMDTSTSAPPAASVAHALTPAQIQTAQTQMQEASTAAPTVNRASMVGRTPIKANQPTYGSIPPGTAMPGSPMSTNGQPEFVMGPKGTYVPNPQAQDIAAAAAQGFSSADGETSGTQANSIPGGAPVATGSQETSATPVTNPVTGGTDYTTGEKQSSTPYGGGTTNSGGGSAPPGSPPPPPGTGGLQGAGQADASTWNEDSGQDNAAVPGGFMGLGSTNYEEYNLNQNAYVDPYLQGQEGLIDSTVSGLQGQQAAQAAQVNIGPAAQEAMTNQGSNYEGALVGQLQQTAAGNGLSAAQDQFQQATDQSIASQFALAHGAQGQGQASALKNAMNNQATTEQTASLQSGEMKAQEQQAAQAQLGTVSGDMATQQYGAALNNAQMANSQSQAQGQLTSTTNLNNAQMYNQQQQGVDSLTQSYLAMGMNLQQAQFQAQMNYASTQQASMAQQTAGLHNVAIAGQAQADSVAGAFIQAGGAAFSGGASLAIPKS